MLTSLRLFSRAPCTRIQSWLSATCPAVRVGVAMLKRASMCVRARREACFYRVRPGGVDLESPREGEAGTKRSQAPLRAGWRHPSDGRAGVGELRSARARAAQDE